MEIFFLLLTRINFTAFHFLRNKIFYGPSIGIFISSSYVEVIFDFVVKFSVRTVRVKSWRILVQKKMKLAEAIFFIDTSWKLWQMKNKKNIFNDELGLQNDFQLWDLLVDSTTFKQEAWKSITGISKRSH